MGLNEQVYTNPSINHTFLRIFCPFTFFQVLHLWLEALASNEEVVRKWYHPWSYMSSPGWVQIKCELRILSKFSFNLNPEWELSHCPNKEEQKPIQEGVKDMLVTHHLFSWDL